MWSTSALPTVQAKRPVGRSTSDRIDHDNEQSDRVERDNGSEPRRRRTVGESLSVIVVLTEL